MLSQLRILRFSLVAGALVLLLAGCGLHSTASAPRSSSPSTGPITEPSTEGTTGLESPQSPSNPGVSVSVATLPVGPGGSQATPDGQHVCVDVQWLGTLPGTVILKVTSVIPRPDPPFMTVDVAVAGCTRDDGPPCAGLRLTAADKGRTCAVGIGERTGGREGGGSVELAGELGCQDPGSAICQQTRASLTAKARSDGSSAGFDFPIPPPDTSPAPDTSPPPDTSSP